MKQREQARIKVLNTVLEYHLPIAQAAEIMGVSERHAKRLLAAYRRDGAAALAHGNRGRRPHNAVPEDAAAAVVRLASNGYAGANHSHFTELLREREGIDLSRPTVRRILVKAGIGSPHAWLGERADKFVLLLAVDDATGTVAQAIFHPTEDTRGYLVLLEGLVRQWGIPLALYSDRHAAFKYNARQGPVLYESTQFARVMRALGIQQIFAMSPQAKGRVERTASTFQDRLVTELRLAGATNMEEANAVLQEYLPRFNARFSVAAEQAEPAYRQVPDDLSLTETVSIRHTRKVARDNTVHYNWRVLQLLLGAERPSYAGLQVEVLERADGELLIRYQGEIVDFQEGEPPASARWGEGTGRAPLPDEPQPASGPASSHLDEDQRKLLAALDSSVEKRAKARKATGKGRAGKEKPVRHQLHRKPTPTQQARWEAVQQAKSRGLSLRAIARELGMAKNTVGKYLKADSPPTKLLSAKERAKAEGLAQVQMAAD